MYSSHEGTKYSEILEMHCTVFDTTMLKLKYTLTQSLICVVLKCCSIWPFSCVHYTFFVTLTAVRIRKYVELLCTMRY